MSTRDVDRLLTTWLAADAPAREPDHLLEAVLATTSRTRRRPGWLIPERWLSMQLTMRWRPVPAMGPVVAVIALLLALAITIVIVGTQRGRLPPPFGIAANGQVIIGVNGDLLIRDTIDGPDRPLITGETSDFAPLFANDGTRFAFFRVLQDPPNERQELWVGRPNGSDVHRLAEFTTMEWFRWSPDGRTIAVTSGEETAPKLAFVDVATAEVTDAGLDFLADQPVSQPAWRPPDGGQLLIRGKDANGDWGFYLIDRQGDLVAKLTLDEGFQEDPYYGENVCCYFLEPAWSPDGTTLAFHTLEPTVRDEDPGWRVRVATVSANGLITQERILATAPEIDDVWRAKWLPDGGGVVVQTLDEGVHGLALYRFDGTQPRDLGLEVRLVGSGEFTFVISPDGRDVIAWSTEPMQAWRIALPSGAIDDLGLVTQEWPTWQRLAP